MSLVRAPVKSPGNNDVAIATARRVREPGVRITEDCGLLPSIGIHGSHTLSVGNEQLAGRSPGDGLHILDLRYRLDGGICLRTGAGKQTQATVVLTWTVAAVLPSADTVSVS